MKQFVHDLTAHTPIMKSIKISSENLFTKMVLNEPIDLVYFDAFSPEKQPEMWSEEQFAKLYEQMNDGGVLVTYCVKGVVRRTLQAVGFKVERIQGPVGGKREILRARK